MNWILNSLNNGYMNLFIFLNWDVLNIQRNACVGRLTGWSSPPKELEELVQFLDFCCRLKTFVFDFKRRIWDTISPLSPFQLLFAGIYIWIWFRNWKDPIIFGRERHQSMMRFTKNLHDILRTCRLYFDFVFCFFLAPLWMVMHRAHSLGYASTVLQSVCVCGGGERVKERDSALYLSIVFYYVYIFYNAVLFFFSFLTCNRNITFLSMGKHLGHRITVVAAT